jgi:hypothetical protein
MYVKKKKKTNEALQKIPYAFCARFLDGNKEREKQRCVSPASNDRCQNLTLTSEAHLFQPTYLSLLNNEHGIYQTTILIGFVHYSTFMSVMNYWSN